jgi:hypothetical protein
MKELISRKQMDRLLEAATLAREPGACRYVKDEQPCCVIAQLAVLHGAEISQIAKYDHHQGDELPAGLGVDSVDLRDFKLEGWDRASLREIQAVWDRRAADRALLLKRGGRAAWGRSRGGRLWMPAFSDERDPVKPATRSVQWRVWVR